MATRRQKKDAAKERIDDLIPSIPPVGPFAAPGRALRFIEALAQELVERDPLQLITDDSKNMAREIVNNPDIMMDANGRLMNNGVQTIRTSGQFSRSNILPRFNDDVSPSKRTRKKTKTDKKMSKALRLANEKFRKKNGQLRKGATQAQIMRYAHKLLKKM